ncbi:MAG: KOW motif-containing protein, partial [Nostocoides sp.]
SLPPPPVAVGDTVKVLAGTLIGLTGKITAVDPTTKVATVAVSVLGLTQSVVLPWTSLQKL